jgi:hypothetical protein
VRFNAAEDAKRKSGELTIAEVLDNLDVEQPSLDRAANRLAGIYVKYHEFENSKPKGSAVAKPVLNQDVYYIFPSDFEICAEPNKLYFNQSQITGDCGEVSHPQPILTPRTEASVQVSTKTHPVFRR